MKGLSSLWAGRRTPDILGRLLSRQDQEATVPHRQRPANWPALNEFDVPKIRGEVAMLEGCVMHALFARVHQATRRLLRRIGFKVRSVRGCCGALHAHSGQLAEAHSLAQGLVERAPNLPLIVNSAGCGSAIKEYGTWLGTKAASNLSARTYDLSEFLLNEGLGEKLEGAQGLGARATYHDACHLAHGQRIRSAPRELLAKVHGLELTPLGESDTCCGSAGIYNLLQPSMARRLLDRKWKNIEQTGARLVILANPGCHAWIAQTALEKGGAVKVMHIAEVLELAFIGGFLPDQRPEMPRPFDR
jgi:glycolate oxidase iron-sulfur subunit